MPRYAVIDNGVVVGVLSASTPPTLNVPRGRIYVDATQLPEIRGGESYDATSGIFSSDSAPQGFEARVSKIEADIVQIQTKVGK